MVMAVGRWCGGVSPVSPIALLLAVLILLLTNGKALEMRTQSNENVESFEDAQRAAKAAMDRINEGVEATEPEGRNVLGELDALKLNDQISSSGLSLAVEKLEGIISGLEEHLSDVGDKKVGLGEIIDEFIPDSSNFLPEEFKSGEYSTKDILTLLRYYKDTLTNMIHLIDNPGAYEEALMEVNKLLEDGIAPEELGDNIEFPFKSATSDLSSDAQNLAEEMKAAFASLQDKTEDTKDFEAMLEESLSYFANEPEHKHFEASAPNGQVCESPDGDHSGGSVPKKDSAWAQKA